MKKKTKIIIGILVVFAILVAGISYREYIKAHTFTLSGNEQIQSITGTVKVSSPKDTEVIFIDVKTGVNYAIPYITSCLLYTSPSPRDKRQSRMPSSA